jgi:hypothetical protein
MIFLDNIVRIVFAKFEEDTLWNFQKLILLLISGLTLLHAEWVEKDECNGDDPEESKRVELKVGYKGKAYHV